MNHEMSMAKSQQILGQQGSIPVSANTSFTLLNSNVGLNESDGRNTSARVSGVDMTGKQTGSQSVKQLTKYKAKKFLAASSEH